MPRPFPPAATTPAPVGSPSAASDLAAAAVLSGRAERAAASRPGEAFKLAAEAYALAAAHPEDRAAAALAAGLERRLKDYAARANAAVRPSPFKTLVEE